MSAPRDTSGDAARHLVTLIHRDALPEEWWHRDVTLDDIVARLVELVPPYSLGAPARTGGA